MLLLTVRDITKHFGSEPVLDGVGFEVRAGQRLALVGPNGTGKTTLLKILSGQLEADAGACQLHGSTRLGYLEQHPDFSSGRTVWQEAHQALGHLVGMLREAEHIADQLATADPSERPKLSRRYDQLHHQLEQRQAYHLDHKLERVLEGLGFTPDEFHRPASQLSGGQQNRLLLAKLLLSEPDLLLLDEPSNHLDLDTTQWLEDFLANSQQAMVLVSDDRYLLDAVATHTLELFHGTIDQYVGNFTAYRRQKAERLEVQRRTYENQQQEIARLEDFVRKNQYGQKHAQAEDRRKKLERIERVTLPREIPRPPMRFPAAERSGDIVLRVEHLSKRFDRPLFQDVTFDILRGQKWGILGPNGAGKTTLLRCMLGELPADEGKTILGTGVKAGYFDQLLRCLAADVQVVDAIRPSHKDFVEQQRRDLLARFGITGEMVFQRVDSLSGGERNRSALAMLAASDANLLILDEPTNHLDLWARDALEEALRSFDGTVLFVSHDRYFMNQVADHLLVLEPPQAGNRHAPDLPHRVRVIEGNYDTYLHLVRQGLAGPATAIKHKTEGDDSGPSRSSPSREGKRANDQPKRKRKFPYRKVTDLEQDIHQCEERIEALHADLGDPDVLRDGQRVKQTTAELEQVQARLAQLYEHWEEASELN